MEKEAKPFILGLLTFLVSYTIARTIETIRRYFIIGDYYDIVDSNFSITGLNLWLRLCYYIFAWTGITIFFYVFESYILNNKTRFMITICSALEGIFSCMLYFTANAFWNFIIVSILFFGVALVPLLFFINLAVKSMYKYQRIAWILIIIGFIFYLLGVMADLPEAYVFVQNLPGEFLHYFNPIAQSIGIILMGSGFIILYRNV